MLSIFNTGGVTLALTIFWLALSGWFGYQAYIAHNSGGADQEPTGTIYDGNKTPYYKIPQFWGVIIVTLLYIIAMLLVASDYKGV